MEKEILDCTRSFTATRYYYSCDRPGCAMISSRLFFFSFVFVRAVRQFRSWNGSDLQLSITGRIIVVLWLENMFPNIEWYICLLPRPGLPTLPPPADKTPHHREATCAPFVDRLDSKTTKVSSTLRARALDAWLCLADQHQSRARTDTYDTRKIWACEYKRNTA